MYVTNLHHPIAWEMLRWVAILCLAAALTLLLSA